METEHTHKLQKIVSFTTIPNPWLGDKNLSLKTKGFLSVLQSMPNGWEPSIRGMEDVLKESKDAILTCKKEAEKAGYLKLEQQKNSDGTFGKTIVTLSGGKHYGR